MRVLVIGAHPDDEVLGVGGTLLKHKSKGDEIYVCITTTPSVEKWGEDQVNREKKYQVEVDKILGTIMRYQLPFPPAELGTIPQGEVAKAISNVIREVKPDIIYTHFKHDIHLDHKITYEATMVATRPPMNIKVLCYETLSETEWGDEAFKPNHYEDITDFIDYKGELFEKYKAEVKDWPHPRSVKGIIVQAQKRGSEICIEAAEGFIIVKSYN